MAPFSFSQENIVFYDDFQYDTSSGFTSFVTSNPANLSKETLIKRVSALPTADFLGYTRPTTAIPRGDAFTGQKSINIIGNTSSENFEADIWLVSDAVNITTVSNLIFSFASQNRFFEGSTKPVVKILVATDYIDGTDPTAVTWTDVTSTIQNAKETFYNDGLWALSYVDLSSFVSATGADKFAVAFKAEYKNEGAFSSTTNRNGQWYVSDFKMAENSTLSVDENLFGTTMSIYPNPASDFINIKNDKNLTIKSISIINVLGQTVYKSGFKSQIAVRNLNKGIYMVKIDVAEAGQSITKKIIIN